MVEKVTPNVHDSLYWVNKNDPRGPQPADPANDPQYTLWEAPVQDWLKTNGQPLEPVTISSSYDRAHNTINKSPKVTFLYPTQNTALPKDIPTTLLVLVTHTETNPILKIDYFINDVLVGGSQTNPFFFSFTPKDIQSIKETNTLKAMATDSLGNVGETSIVFTVK
jgi:hypothetical protein